MKGSNLLILLFFLIGFTSLSSATGKRMRNDDEASTSNSQTKLAPNILEKLLDSDHSDEIENINWQNINYQQTLFNIVDRVQNFGLICTPETLLRFKEIDKNILTKLLKKCDNQVLIKFKEKVSRLGSEGQIMKKWLKKIDAFIRLKANNFDLMIKDDMRKDSLFSKKIRNSWIVPLSKFKKSGEIYGDEALESSQRAYYLGDGFCVHILAPPFDKAEEFMEVVVNEFGDLQHVKNFKNENAIRPASIKIYILQKLCRKFKENIFNNKHVTARIKKLPNAKSAGRYLIKYLNDGKIKNDDGFQCDWRAVYEHKKPYRALNRLQGKSFLKYKKKVDNSVDMFVLNCLTQMAENEDANQIYAKFDDQYLFKSLQEMLNKFAFALASYPISTNQSINSLLDIRDPRNPLIASLMSDITSRLINTSSNLEALAKLYTDFLLGKFSDFQSGAFREVIYEQKKLTEYKLLEFLSHIFSIEGYKPSAQISSPLLNFYYLYKMSESCNMTPIRQLELNLNQRDEGKKIQPIFATKLLDDGNMDDLEYVKTTLLMIDWKDTFEFGCTPKGLIEIGELGDEKETNFIRECEEKFADLVKKKTHSLGTLGATIIRYMIIIKNYIKEKDFNLMLNKDMRTDEVFSKRTKDVWQNSLVPDKDERPQQKGRKLSDMIAHLNLRHGFFLGDGICVHILAAPFDRVEQFMEVLLKDFRHLDYIKAIENKETSAPASLLLYIFQKLCRKSYETPGQDSDSQKEISMPIYDFSLFNDAQKARDELKLRIDFHELQVAHSCEWSGVFTRKQDYRILQFLRNESDFSAIKEYVDKSMDKFVSKCLAPFVLKKYERFYVRLGTVRLGTKSRKHVLFQLNNELRTLINSYELGLDESINNILDIRSADSKIKQKIVNLINNISDTKLAKLFADFLHGHLGKPAKGIFRDLIYKKRHFVEHKLVEFLFHVFDIKGYKPKISDLESRLLDFYYLYKMSEICYMIPVEESTKLDEAEGSILRFV